MLVENGRTLEEEREDRREEEEGWSVGTRWRAGRGWDERSERGRERDGVGGDREDGFKGRKECEGVGDSDV